MGLTFLLLTFKYKYKFLETENLRLSYSINLKRVVMVASRVLLSIKTSLEENSSEDHSPMSVAKDVYSEYFIISGELKTQFQVDMFY